MEQIHRRMRITETHSELSPRGTYCMPCGDAGTSTAAREDEDQRVSGSVYLIDVSRSCRVGAVFGTTASCRGPPVYEFQVDRDEAAPCPCHRITPSVPRAHDIC